MCIIISKPKGKEIPRKHLENSRDNNKDGVGIMYAVDKKVVIEKWLDKDYSKFLERLKALKDLNVVVHYRAASVGDVSLDNIHPFWVFEDKLAMCHNGTILNCKELIREKESDTVAFARLLRDFPDDFLQREGLLLMMKSYIGTSSRIAFMDTNGTVAIMNSRLGEEVDGIWYSNKYYTAPGMRFGGSVEFPSSCGNTSIWGGQKRKQATFYNTPKKQSSRYMEEDISKAKNPRGKYYVFVYGTLKKGLHNHRYLEGQKFVGEGITTERYPLIGENFSYPYLLDLKGKGELVKGELYEVSYENLTERLDVLEGYPSHYKRKIVPVATKTGVFSAIAYFKAKETLGDSKEKFLQEWTPKNNPSKKTSQTTMENLFYESSMEYDDDYCMDVIKDNLFMCQDCGNIVSANDIFDDGQSCSACGSDYFEPCY